MRPLLAVACLAGTVKSIRREARQRGGGGGGRRGRGGGMEREVCLETAGLEENEPLLTTQKKQRGDARARPRARPRARAGPARSPVFLRL